MGYAARNPYILFKKLKHLEHGEALLKFFLEFCVNWGVRELKEVRPQERRLHPLLCALPIISQKIRLELRCPAE